MDAIPPNEHPEMLRFFTTPLDASLTADIQGNAPISIKELPVKWLAFFRGRGHGFCHNTAESIKVKEVSIVPTADDPQKLEGKVVCEVMVTRNMCDSEGVVPPGVLIFLIDECSVLSMVVAKAGEGQSSPAGVSCSINAIFHGTATAGTTLRIANHSLATSLQSNSGRTEVWDIDNHRLVASGTQVSMAPSVPTSRTKL